MLPNKPDLTVRIHFLQPDGSIVDGEYDATLDDFGGILPSKGDIILNPGAAVGANRSAAADRAVWTVVSRVFNPRDNADYVALVVEERPLTAREHVFLPGS